MSHQKISCVIVDDDPMALNLVESYVEKTPFLELKKKCSSAIEAMEFIKNEAVDVFFLDIQMPDLTGVEFSKMLPKESRVIFTTAFDQYALEGFKVEALDYLLKPFDYAEFLTAANKARTWFDLVKGKKQNIISEEKEFLFVKSEYKQLRIKLADVLYFERSKRLHQNMVERQSQTHFNLDEPKIFRGRIARNPIYARASLVHCFIKKY